MPELPEVETLRRALQQSLPSKTIAEVWQSPHALRAQPREPLKKLIAHYTIQAVGRRGKFMLLFLSLPHPPHNAPAKPCLWLHLGMSGRLRWVAAQTMRDKHDHWQMRFVGRDDNVLRYNDPRRFGGVGFLSSWAECESAFSLGPEPITDILSPTLIAQWGTQPPPPFNADYLWAKTRRSSQAIKVWLLNGANVAGVGNIYASEALFLANILPTRAANTLRRAECAHLVAAVQTILRRAIDAGGSTLRDYRQLSGEMGDFQFDFAVYDRAGELCPRCVPKRRQPFIVRIVQAGRSTFFCPHCQH